MTGYGRVKFFDPRRGFGFISQELGPPDVFLHVSVMHEYGLVDTQLDPGTPVRFLVKESNGRRPEATCIALA